MKYNNKLYISLGCRLLQQAYGYMRCMMQLENTEDDDHFFNIVLLRNNELLQNTEYNWTTGFSEKL